MNKEPLKNKKHISKMGEPSYYVEGYTKEEIKSAVEWLLSKRLGRTLKAVTPEGREMIVYYKDNFDESFEDVIKGET